MSRRECVSERRRPKRWALLQGRVPLTASRREKDILTMINPRWSFAQMKGAELRPEVLLLFYPHPYEEFRVGDGISSERVCHLCRSAVIRTKKWGLA